MPSRTDCPVCGNEMIYASGRFGCRTVTLHTPEAVINAVTHYDRSMVAVKTKLSFNADWTGPNAVYELDSRIVTKLYADGSKFVIRLEDNAMTQVQVLYVNEIVVRTEMIGERDCEVMFRTLSGRSLEEFDHELYNRMGLAEVPE
jgi:hypothetical protein